MNLHSLSPGVRSRLQHDRQPHLVGELHGLPRRANPSPRCVWSPSAQRASAVRTSYAVTRHREARSHTKTRVSGRKRRGEPSRSLSLSSLPALADSLQNERVVLSRPGPGHRTRSEPARLRHRLCALTRPAHARVDPAGAGEPGPRLGAWQELGRSGRLRLDLDASWPASPRPSQGAHRPQLGRRELEGAPALLHRLTSTPEHVVDCGRGLWTRPR